MTLVLVGKTFKHRGPWGSRYIWCSVAQPPPPLWMGHGPPLCACGACGVGLCLFLMLLTFLGFSFVCGFGFYSRPHLYVSGTRFLMFSAWFVVFSEALAFHVTCLSQDKKHCLVNRQIVGRLALIDALLQWLSLNQTHVFIRPLIGSLVFLDLDTWNGSIQSLIDLKARVVTCTSRTKYQAWFCIDHALTAKTAAYVQKSLVSLWSLATTKIAEEKNIGQKWENCDMGTLYIESECKAEKEKRHGIHWKLHHRYASTTNSTKTKGPALPLNLLPTTGGFDRTGPCDWRPLPTI